MSKRTSQVEMSSLKVTIALPKVAQFPVAALVPSYLKQPVLCQNANPQNRIRNNNPLAC